MDHLLEVHKAQSGCWCSLALRISTLSFVIWSLVPLPCRNPACSSAMKVHDAEMHIYISETMQDEDRRSQWLKW